MLTCHHDYYRWVVTSVVICCDLRVMTVSSLNKPDRATMRPGRVSACIDHVTYDGEHPTARFSVPKGVMDVGEL